MSTERATTSPWEQLRSRLQERFEMAREVLDANGHESVAVLVPVEEVLIWMGEIEEQSGRGSDDA